MLGEELGINEDSSSNQNTYVSVSMSKTEIINHHKTIFKEKFNITLDSDTRESPGMCWF